MNDGTHSQSVEQVTPYAGDNRPKSSQVREMFDNIAPSYDALNRTMTFGIDKQWRKKGISMLSKTIGDAPSRVLDIATGTGDLLIQIANKMTNAQVEGIDLSEKMLEVCQEKIKKAGLESRASAVVGDCLALPFADDTFDGITCAFGVRNFEHLADGYKQMHRVLKPGACVCIIEISNPTNPVLYALYKIYTRKFIPLLGRLISKDAKAYSYLPESVSKVPQGEDMLNLMREAGFKNAKAIQLTFGACSIYFANK